MFSHPCNTATRHVLGFRTNFTTTLTFTFPTRCQLQGVLNRNQVSISILLSLTSPSHGAATKRCKIRQHLVLVYISATFLVDSEESEEDKGNDDLSFSSNEQDEDNDWTQIWHHYIPTRQQSYFYVNFVSSVLNNTGPFCVEIYIRRFQV
jgi:hypothetical protein